MDPNTYRTFNSNLQCPKFKSTELRTTTIISNTTTDLDTRLTTAEGNISTAQSEINTLQDQTQNLTATPTTSTFSDTLIANADITQNSGTATLKAVAADSVTISGSSAARVFSQQYTASSFATDIEFTGIPTWAKRIRINFVQLSANTANAAATFYIQPGSTSGYWANANNYCGQQSVFSVTTGQSGLTVGSYIQFPHTTVNTGTVNMHFSGYFEFEKCHTSFGSSEYWSMGGSVYTHAQSWLSTWCGGFWSPNANEPLSKIRIVNNTAGFGGTRWGVSPINITYFG